MILIKLSFFVVSKFYWCSEDEGCWLGVELELSDSSRK